jgi:hypothetical protein
MISGDWDVQDGLLALEPAILALTWRNALSKI